MRSPQRGSNVDSTALEKHLKQALNKREVVETQFRVQHVHHWTVLFCDVSKVLNEAADIGSETRSVLIEKYRALCGDIIEAYQPPFNSKDEGPQVLACFDSAEEACEAAIKIQKALQPWHTRRDGRQYFIPAIGLHTGDFVVKDGELKQSNACNIGKRIQTEAKPGEIYLSAAVNEDVEPLKRFQIKYERTAYVKNIPEPQKIYRLEWKRGVPAETVASRTKKAAAGFALEKEEVVQGFMGVLVCDVAGSSKKFWNLGDREGNLLIEMYRKEVFPVLMKFQASSIEISEGDQITAAFPEKKVVNTALAAIQIQKDLFRRNSNMAQRERFKLNVSIGLHCGDITLRNKKVVHNETFYTAKAIQDEAEANEIYLSGQMQQFMQGYSKMHMLEVGETQVKGTDIVVPLYALQWHKSGI